MTKDRDISYTFTGVVYAKTRKELDEAAEQQLIEFFGEMPASVDIEVSALRLWSGEVLHYKGEVWAKHW